METIIGKINGVSLECIPSIPIVENMHQIFEFQWDDSNLSGIWQDFNSNANVNRKAYFRNSSTGKVWE